MTNLTNPRFCLKKDLQDSAQFSSPWAFKSNLVYGCDVAAGDVLLPLASAWCIPWWEVNKQSSTQSKSYRRTGPIICKTRRAHSVHRGESVPGGSAQVKRSCCPSRQPQQPDLSNKLLLAAVPQSACWASVPQFPQLLCLCSDTIRTTIRVAPAAATNPFISASMDLEVSKWGKYEPSHYIHMNAGITTDIVFCNSCLEMTHFSCSKFV